MFSLRNGRSDAAVAALCDGLGDASALFRHEVAYVLGQLEHAAAVPALAARLRDAGEHSMVRHEAAESLGAIAAACAGGAAAAACEAVLRAYLGDPERVVAESCAAALDINAYWTAFNAGEGGGEGAGVGVGEGAQEATAAESVSYAALKRQQDRQRQEAAGAAVD